MLMRKLRIHNIGAFHGSFEMSFKNGLNIVIPSLNTYDDMPVGAEFSELFDPDHSFNIHQTIFSKDLLDVFGKVKNGYCINELIDYSLFADSNYCGFDVSFNHSIAEYELANIKTYRGALKNHTLVNGSKDSDYLDSSFGDSLYLNDIPMSGDFDNEVLSLRIKYFLGNNPVLLKLAELICKAKRLNDSTLIIDNSFGLNQLMFDDLMCAFELFMEIRNITVIVIYDDPWCPENRELVLSVVKQVNDSIPGLYSVVNFSPVTKLDYSTVSVRLAARDLIIKQELSLEAKVRHFEDVVFYALKHTQNPAIAFSGGKDSLLMLFLISRVVEKHNLSKPMIVFSNTGIEFPEHLVYTRRIMETYRNKGYKTNEIKPSTTFWKVADEYGFPMFGKAIRVKENPKLYELIKRLDIKTCGNKCCELLKEEPAKKFYTFHNIDLVFTGIMAEESYQRRSSYYRAYKKNYEDDVRFTGEFFFNSSEKRYKCTPMIHFLQDDVYSLIEMFNLEMSPSYRMGYYKDLADGSSEWVATTRTGCWACSMSIGYEDNNLSVLRHTHPRLWELLMIKKGLAKEIFKVKHLIAEAKWNDDAEVLLSSYLKSKPCHFDIA